MRTHALFVVALTVLFPLYGWRLSYGVDISDEGYYAAMPVSWLRSTPAETGNLCPHQFSAALYFPLVRLYAAVRPDLTGLMHFMRWVYLIGSCLTCVAGYRFFVRVTTPVAATAAALCLFVFIPLGLPTVSYNTLAVFGLASGLFTLARAVLDREATGRGGWLSLGVASVLMAAGGVAYPSVAVLAPLALAGVFVAFPAQRRFTLAAAAGWFACTLGLLAIITAWLGGVGRLAEVIDFTRKLYAGSLGEKAEVAGESLFGPPQLWLPTTLAVLFGVVRRLRPAPLTRLLHAAGVLGVLAWWVTSAGGPALFSKAHDAVFVLCAAHLPLVRWPRASLPAGERLLAVLFAFGLAGGFLVVGSSAVPGLVNFPLFGVVAAASGLAVAGRGERPSPLEPLAACGVVAALVWASPTYIHGEVPVRSPLLAPATMPCVVEHGPYAGLHTADWKIDILESVESQLRPYHGHRTIDFWSTNAGLYLLTPFELRTPMPYWMEDAKTTHLHEKLKQHYADPHNRPDVVVLWTMTQEQDTKVDREQLAVLAEHYTEQPAEMPIRIFVRK